MFKVVYGMSVKWLLFTAVGAALIQPSAEYSIRLLTCALLIVQSLQTRGKSFTAGDLLF